MVNKRLNDLGSRVSVYIDAISAIDMTTMPRPKYTAMYM